MATELAVRLAHDLIGLVVLSQDQDGVDLDIALGPLESDDGRVTHAWVAGEDLLDVVGMHLGAVRHHEHVLLAPLEREEAVRVEDSVVAGVIPAFLEHGGGRLGALPISLEHVRSAHQDLAVRRDLDVDAGQHLADSADAVVLDARERHNRRRLGRPVTLQRDDAHLLPASRHVRVHRRTADRQVFQRATQPAQDRAEEEAPSPHRDMACHVVQSFEGRSTAVRIDAALDGVVEQLHHLRHGKQHRHLPLAEGPRQHRRLEAGRIDDRCTAGQRCQEARIQAVHVRQGQDRQEARLGAERHDAAEGDRIDGDVAMREHHALRIARGP